MQRLRHLAQLLIYIGIASVSLFGCRPSERALTEKHGAVVYQKMCGVCHGSKGDGYKADRAPAVTHPEFLASVSDEFLRQAIAAGRRGTTMSAWGIPSGGPLTPKDVDAVVAFLRSWERHPRAILDESKLAGDAQRGEETYSRECARCHGPRGIGGTYLNIGKPQLLGTASNGFLRHAIRKGRPGTAMLGYHATLGDAAIDDVITAMRAWEAEANAPPPYVHPTPPPPPPPIPLGPVPLNPKGPEPVGFKKWPATTPADVIKKAVDAHSKMAFLDARAPSDYLIEHISGAVSVPFYDPEPYFAKLPKNAWLVCYCACPHAESGQLAQKLLAKGFTKVTVLDEGLGVWRSRKYGTQLGSPSN